MIVNERLNSEKCDPKYHFWSYVFASTVSGKGYI